MNIYIIRGHRTVQTYTTVKTEAGQIEAKFILSVLNKFLFRFIHYSQQNISSIQVEHLTREARVSRLLVGHHG